VQFVGVDAGLEGRGGVVMWLEGRCWGRGWVGLREQGGGGGFSIEEGGGWM